MVLHSCREDPKKPGKHELVDSSDWSATIIRFVLRAEGRKEEGRGCGENKICCLLTSSRFRISQHSWSHQPVPDFL